MFSSQKTYYANVSDVPRSLQSWVSTIQTVVLTADVVQLIKKITADVLQYFYELISYRSYSQLTFTIQTVVLTADVFQLKKYIFFWGSWKTSAVSTTCLNGWNSTLQAAWHIRHVRIIRFLWTKPTIWLLILSFTQNIVRACSMIIMKDIGRWLPWMLPGSNRTIVHNHSVHWYCCITLIKGMYYIKHDINGRHGKQNPRRGRWVW